MLKQYLQQLVATQNLEAHRKEAQNLAACLSLSMEDLAAALLYLHQDEREPANAATSVQSPVPATRMVRYRLNVGSRHKITPDQLVTVLVNESGVDKKNISNINIHYFFTFVELPDCMPQDIFLHLKTVEINKQKLDIKRVKPNFKKKRDKRRFKPSSSSPAARPVSSLPDYVSATGESRLRAGR
jgi:hypothetical protein